MQPMNAHELLRTEAEEAVNKIFSDTSVSQHRTKESLEKLKDYIDERIESLDI